MRSGDAAEKPRFDSTLRLLMGLSKGSYLGFKSPAAHG
jgi:hypothetical protein